MLVIVLSFSFLYYVQILYYFFTILRFFSTLRNGAHNFRRLYKAPISGTWIIHNKEEYNLKQTVNLVTNLPNYIIFNSKTFNFISSVL
ncbi:hypothetical protein IC575_023494 [Cucumis melo]